MSRIRYILMVMMGIFYSICAQAQKVDTVGAGSQGVIYKVIATPGSTYQWFIDGGTIVSAANQSQVTVNWGNDQGLYRIGVLERSAAGCFGDTVWQAVFISRRTFPIIDGNAKICMGESTLLVASGPDSVYKDLSYLWMTGETSQSILVSPVRSTTYYCIVYYNGDAVDTAFLNVEVIAVPAFSFSWTPLQPKKGQDIKFFFNTKPQWDFTWDFNGEKDESQQPVIFKAFDTVGYVTIELNVSNELGCSEMQSKRIYINSESDFLVPQAFSPNGDGINDVFIVDFAPEYSKIDAKIFNRWGNLIFQSQDHHLAWDGSMNGVMSSDGTYVILIEAYNASGKRVRYDGTIVLVK